ncbi:MAG: hypothetical protein H6Q25_116 [Bacteroidetes bacterium]|nr:hypothetical protein [Bacteroidota bacterium]
MNMNKKNIINLIIGVLLLGSCTPKLNKYRVPEQIKYIESQLIDTLKSYDNTHFLNITSYKLIPLITNKESEGVYSYTDFRIHYTWYLTFMYDGKNVYFTNIDDSIGMHTFLDTCGFSKYKIRKFERKIKKIQKRNDEINKSQTY